MFKSFILIFSSIFSLSALAASEPTYCKNIVEETCGTASELDYFSAKLMTETAAYLNRCLVNSPQRLKLPPRWAMESSPSGRALLAALKKGSTQPFSLQDMYEYDQAYVWNRVTEREVQSIVSEILPLMKSSEALLIDSQTLHEFVAGVKSDLKTAIELRGDVSNELKSVLFTKIEQTKLVLPSEYLTEKANQPGELLNAYRGYYSACQNNGQGMNAFNDGEFRVVLCPGLFVAAQVNAKIKRKNLIDSVILPRDENPRSETSRMRLPEISAIADCSSETDLMSLYTIVAHELGHSIDGGMSVIGDELDVGTELSELWTCQQKQYPAVRSSDFGILENFQALIGRNREMTADFWAAQTLSVRLNQTELPHYTRDGFMREMKSNMGIFCTKAFEKGSKIEFQAESSGHLHGTKRIEAFLDQSPELSRSLGCVSRGQSACHL